MVEVVTSYVAICNIWLIVTIFFISSSEQFSKSCMREAKKKPRQTGVFLRIIGAVLPYPSIGFSTPLLTLVPGQAKWL
jgi:hypothetical protein